MLYHEANIRDFTKKNLIYEMMGDIHVLRFESALRRSCSSRGLLLSTNSFRGLLFDFCLRCARRIPPSTDGGRWSNILVLRRLRWRLCLAQDTALVRDSGPTFVFQNNRKTFELSRSDVSDRRIKGAHSPGFMRWNGKQLWWGLVFVYCVWGEAPPRQLIQV